MRKKYFVSRNRFIVIIVVLSLIVLALGLLVNVASAVPVISATKVDHLIVDNDGDGVADPGDTIRYTVVVTNSGTMNASNVGFADAIDANTTLVAGSIKTTPIARHDIYASLGNVGITVPAPGVLVNDNDPDGGSVSVIADAGGTANGGAFSIGSDGAFSYLPPTGFEGTDSFNYLIQDADFNQDRATVYVSVTEMIWFINNSASSSGGGGITAPFNSISAFNAIQTGTAPGAKDGDIVFLYSGSGNYNNGIVLRNGQTLIGQGAASSIADITGITVPTHSNTLPTTGGTRPTITTASGDGVLLGLNNQLQGFDIGNTAGVGISDNGGTVGTLTVNEVAVSGTGGGIEIDNGGVVAITLDSLSASSSTDEGIHLAGASGVFVVSDTNGTIGNTGVPAVVIDGNPTLGLGSGAPGPLTFASVSSSGAANGIVIHDAIGGFTIAGSGGTCSSEASCTGGTIKNTSGDGVSLQNAYDISLNYMFLDFTGGQGINGSNVANFTLANSVVTRCGNAVNEGCLRMVNLFGNAAITNSDLSFPAERVALIDNSGVTMNLTVSGSTFRDTQSSGTGADGLEITSDGASNTTIDIVNSSFLRNRTNGLQVFSQGTSVVNADVTGSTFDRGTGSGIGMDLAAANSATLNFNVIGNPLINGRGSNAINVFSDDSATVQGRINDNPDIQAGGSTSSGFGISAQANTNSNMTLEIDNNVISNIGFDAGIQVLSRLGAGRLDATISNNNVTVDATNSLYDIWVQAQNNNTTCANVTNNTTSTASVAAFRARTVDAGSTVILPGTGATATDVWNNNGNTPANSVDSSQNGTLTLGGACNTVNHPTVSSAPAPVTRSYPDFPLAQAGAGEAGPALAAARTSKRTPHAAKSATVARAARSARFMPANSGEAINLTLGALDPGQVVVISFDVTVDSGISSSVSQVCNQGVVSGDNFADMLTDDPTVGGVSDPTCTAVEVASVDLQVRKSDNNFEAEPGDTINYTIRFTNTSSIAATGVVLTDTVPQGTVFSPTLSTPGWNCTGTAAGNICTYDLGTVAGNFTTGSLVYGVEVLDPLNSNFNFIVNGVAIGDDGAGGPDETPGDNFSVAITPVDARTDLQVRKSDHGIEVLPGDTIQYTIRFTNTGTNIANGVVLTDTVPQGTVFSPTLSTPGWNCTGTAAGSLCTFDLGTVNSNNAGGSLVYGVEVLDPLNSNFNFIVNGVAIGDDGAGGLDQNPGDNFSIAITPVDARTDLQVRKRDFGIEVEPGDTIQYTIRFTNTGTNTANGVVLTDTVPQGTVFSPTLSTPGWNCLDKVGGSLCTYDIGTVGPNFAGGSLVYGVEVLDPLPSVYSFIVNGVAIGDDGAGGPDQNPGDNFSIAITPVDARTDLQVRKRDFGIEVEPGDTIQYTIRFTNTGTNTANGVVLTDTVPQGTVFSPTLSTPGWNCLDKVGGSLCTYDIGTVGPNFAGGSLVYGVEVLSPADAFLQFIINGVAIGDDGAGGPDQNPGDNFSIAITPLNATPDLQISKDDGVDFVEPGGTINYTIVYTNAGNRNVDSTIISETVPANTTFDFGSNPDGFICNPATGEEGANCMVNVGTVPGNGGGGSVTFAVIVDNPLTPGVTETTNVVDIYGIAATADANPDDNSAEHVTLLNVPPEITGISPATQTVQYSDLVATVTITATDPGPDDLTLAASAALPDALALSAASCGPATGGGKECTWTLSGQMLEAAGTYTVEVTASDGLLTSEPAVITFTVEHEETRAAFDGANPVSVPVVSDGGDSEPFTLVVDVTEFDDPDDVTGDSNLAGDISLAQVTMTLVPVGPGGSESPTSCSASTSPGLVDPDSPHDYDILTVSCDFEDVPVNTYVVQVDVGGDYYTGGSEDVLTVYDPSLGFTTGGGWFYWPGTNDKTNFGYTMKYNKKATKVQGSLLVIRHLPDGSIYRLKSNSLDGLALGDENDYGWATFSGKATYLGAGMIEAEGNHRFIVYVEDHGEPGAGFDRFWLETQDKDGAVVGDLSLEPTAAANAVTIEGGNIVVPQKPKGKGRQSLTEQAETSTADEPLATVDEMAIFVAGESYESLVVDANGRRLGQFNGQPLAEIPEAAYQAESYAEADGEASQTELFWLAAGEYEVEIRGQGDGQVEVQVLAPKNRRFATIFVFEDLATSSSSVAVLQMSDAPVLESDLDGDGQVDQVLEPAEEVRVRLASLEVFLPAVIVKD